MFTVLSKKKRLIIYLLAPPLDEWPLPFTLKKLPEKQSILDAIEHLFAKYLEIRPLFLAPARPMNEEWKMSPYFGVLPFFLSALRGNIVPNVITPLVYQDMKETIASNT